MFLKLWCISFSYRSRHRNSNNFYVSASVFVAENNMRPAAANGRHSGNVSRAAAILQVHFRFSRRVARAQWTCAERYFVECVIRRRTSRQDVALMYHYDDPGTYGRSGEACWRTFWCIVLTKNCVYKLHKGKVCLKFTVMTVTQTFALSLVVRIIKIIIIIIIITMM